MCDALFLNLNATLVDAIVVHFFLIVKLGQQELDTPVCQV